MKSTLIFLFALIALSPLLAQGQAVPAALETAVDAMVQKYQLNDEQRAEAVIIQKRRLRNLAEIESLKDTDYKRYLKKKDFIREATLASTKRMLSREQMPLLNEVLIDRRKRESALIEKLKAQGASQEEMQIAIWELE
jgi:hypothetical protein